MFSLGLNEILLIVFVAVLVIAPSDMPRVMKALGKFFGKTRIFTRNLHDHFNSFIDKSLLAEEVEDEEKK